MESARHQFSILKQICEFIHGHLVQKLAREHGVDKKSRKFDPWSLWYDMGSLIWGRSHLFY